MWSKLATIGFILLSSVASADTIYEDENLSITLSESRLYVDGILDDGSSLIIINALLNTQPDYLAINSYGGVAREGFRLGNFLHRHNIPTVIEYRDVCASACAFAALGSSNVTINGYLAFHSPFYTVYYQNSSLDDIYNLGIQTSATMIDYTTSLGYSLNLPLTIASATDSDTFMVFDSSDNLNAYRVDNPLDTPVNENRLFDILDANEILIRAQQ